MPTSFVSVQVLLTTNNFPDLMLEAYNQNRLAVPHMSPLSITILDASSICMGDPRGIFITALLRHMTATYASSIDESKTREVVTLDFDLRFLLALRHIAMYSPDINQKGAHWHLPTFLNARKEA